MRSLCLSSALGLLSLRACTSTKRENVDLCTEILLASITGAVVNSELLSDLVREAVDISEAAKAAREAELRRQAELERRMEVARLQAVELFCTELLFMASDKGVEGVEARREAVRKAERERVQVGAPAAATFFIVDGFRVSGF